MDASSTLIDPFQHLHDCSYRIGNYQCLLYDSKREDVFPQPFLYNLWKSTKESGRRKHGALDLLFSDSNIGPDYVCSYLSRVPVFVMGEWSEGFEDETVFTPYGYAFFSYVNKAPSGKGMAFGNYVFFSGVWGRKREGGSAVMELLAALCVSMMFKDYNLMSLKGLRYPDNVLTKRFMEKFGFRDVGLLKDYSIRNGDLSDSVLSQLSRNDFEAYLLSWMLQWVDAVSETSVL